MLLNVLRNIGYLVRQSLPLRGTWDYGETGYELNSNFQQLMLLRWEEDSKIAEWIKGKEYSNPAIQTEIIDGIRGVETNLFKHPKCIGIHHDGR